MQIRKLILCVLLLCMSLATQAQSPPEQSDQETIRQLMETVISSPVLTNRLISVTEERAPPEDGTANPALEPAKPMEERRYINTKEYPNNRLQKPVR